MDPIFLLRKSPTDEFTRFTHELTHELGHRPKLPESLSLNRYLRENLLGFIRSWLFLGYVAMPEVQAVVQDFAGARISQVLLDLSVRGQDSYLSLLLTLELQDAAILFILPIPRPTQKQL